MKMLINGAFCDASTKETMNVTNPYDGRVIDTVPKATEEDLRAAMEGAAKAQKEWARVPVWRRAAILSRFAALVAEQADSLAETLCLDNGKPLTQARAELANIQISVPAFTEKAKHLYDTLIPCGSEANYERHLQAVVREPVGVVVCIVPFNFPSNLFCQKVVPALLSGNAAVVLPPSGNPLTVLRLSALLHEAGVPAGVIQCVTAPGAVKEAAVTHPACALVTLTGSTATGAHIAGVAAARLTPCALELGGNDAFIVMEDADLSLAVSELFVGRLVNAGQICCASKRFLVHRSLERRFIDAAVDLVKSLKAGDPMEADTRIGVLINERAAAEVEEQVRATLAAGAVLETGGTRKGAFFAPTVLSGVTRDMDIAKDMEVFGPVIPVIPFDTEEEAIAIANQSSYGLSGCIFSENHRRILRMTKALETGTVIINGASNLRSFEMPFGGWKQSGVGTEGVMSTFEEMTRTKVVILKNYDF